MKYTVGFIGLGHMGLPMASNLLKSDLVDKLVIFDLAKDPVAKLAQNGAVAATNIGELTRQCDIVFTMLQTGEQVYDVCTAPEGIFDCAKDNLFYIDCSSISVATSRELHQTAQKKGIQMLDAPVSGGVKGAETASLTIMVGGEQAILESMHPILSAIGKNIIPAGAAGNGQLAKICNNMILGISMIAVSEAFNLGEKLGLKAQNLFDIVSKGSGQCWSLTSYCPSPGILENVPSSNDYKAGFTAQMMLKDLKLSQSAANSANVSTPLGAAATALYSMYSNHDGQEDFSGIIKFLSGEHN